MNRITGDELMSYLNDRIKKYNSKKKKGTLKDDLDLVKADAMHIKAHPNSKEDIDELIEDISKAQKNITGGTLYVKVKKDKKGKKDMDYDVKDDGLKLLVQEEDDNLLFDDMDSKVYDDITGQLKGAHAGYIDKDGNEIRGDWSTKREYKDLSIPELRDIYDMQANDDKATEGMYMDSALKKRDKFLEKHKHKSIGDKKEAQLIRRQIEESQQQLAPLELLKLVKEKTAERGARTKAEAEQMQAIQKKIKKEKMLKLRAEVEAEEAEAVRRDEELGITPEMRIKLDKEAATKIAQEYMAKLKVFEDARLKEDIDRAQKLLEPELSREAKKKQKKKDKKKASKATSGGAAEEEVEEVEEEEPVQFYAHPELVAKEEVVDKPTKSKKDKSLINPYELDIDIKRVQQAGEANLGEAFEEVLLQPKYESILQKTFGDSSPLHSTSTIPELQGIFLSTGMSLPKACIYDMYSNNNVFELKNYHELSHADIVKKGGLYINVAKLIGSEVYRPEFYTEDGEVKLYNVHVGVMDEGVRKDFKLFNKSGKTLHFIYNLSDGVYKYDISNDKEFELIPLLDSSGTQIKRNGKKIMVYNPVQSRVVQGTFLGKQCFVLNPKHLHKI